MHCSCFCCMEELVCKWVDCMGERLDLMSELMLVLMSGNKCLTTTVKLRPERVFSRNGALTTEWVNEELTVSHGVLGKLKRELKRWLLCSNPILDCSSGCLDVVQVCPSENNEWERTEIKAVTLRGIMRSQRVLRHLTYFSHTRPYKLYQRNALEHLQ